ncbi:MAG: alpha-mannosidase [Clostridia bacterium]|nr:alpha-mannosidase [Clostridia bacterium]
MKNKKHLFLVGNAHLDPVWQWRWQEGSAEAKATVRSALDRMKEFPDFRFVCSSASVYKWVEEFAPEMFEEVRERVREGRFIVVGGWHVQPDCNLPSGEAFARQTLYSQRYFKEKLGVYAKVGYNVDSFGHNAMMPQILRKSGMNAYIYMRPAPHEQDRESDVFNWIAPDGSEVLAYRILDPYCFNFSDMDKLEGRVQFLNEHSRTDLDELPFFYGVGNHGGGPTIRNLELLGEYAKAHPEMELTYSDLSDFFDTVRESGQPIPEYRGDLQHHAAGCYAAVHAIKSGIRRSECELIAAESYSMLARHLCGKKVRNDRFAEAWQNVCFLHFHDIMDGCCIKEAYDDTAYMYGMAQNIAAVEENNALQTLSWAIDTKSGADGLPVVVFNPHSFDVEECIQVNKQVYGVTDADGTVIPHQLVRSSTKECYNRDDTLFKVKVPALGYTVYYLKESADGEPSFESSVKASAYSGYRMAYAPEHTVLENEFLRIAFELHTGYIVSMIDKRAGKEMISGRACVPTVIDEYSHDTWSHGKNFFTDVMARFGDAEVTVLESGPVRGTVKVVNRYNDSILTQYFSLEEGCDRLKVRAHVDWHEKHKMLKLAWPMSVEMPRAYYEIPYGVIERPADGEEEPGLTWTAIKGEQGGFAILNNGTYSSSVKDNVLYHTVLRSPIFGDHNAPRDSESDFTDQGRIEFAYELMAVGEEWSPVIKAAGLLNKHTSHVIENRHEGCLKELGFSGLQVSAENVIVSALKRSEDGRGTVIRIYETEGRETAVTVDGALLPAQLDTVLTPYSANTYYLPDGEKLWREVLMMEDVVSDEEKH